MEKIKDISAQGYNKERGYLKTGPLLIKQLILSQNH